MNAISRNLLVSIIKNPYAWPGGYERLLVLNDGAILCSQCCRKQAANIMWDCRNNLDTGWLPIASTYEACHADCTGEVSEDLLSYCDHCPKEFGELA